MKVATRITVATAVVVAIASAAYASFDLRARTSERQMAMEREAKALANTLRTSLETQAAAEQREARFRADQLQRDLDSFEKKALGGNPDILDVTRPAALPEHEKLRAEHAELKQRVLIARRAAGLERPLDLALAYRSPGEGQLRELERASGGWHVIVISRAQATELPITGMTEPQLRRIKTLFDVPHRAFSDVEEEEYYYAVPLRAASAREDERVVLGMLEISRSADALNTDRGDLGRALLLVLLIIVVTTVVVAAAANRFVSRPITKLLRGIDDVAKGDLSHVILSEHDDEIGAIATRFNEMTFSLRESRAETQRQNEATLALEQRLGQTEKLATLGQLAAEIAHEVGTPLNVIAGRARSIQRKSRDPEAVEKNAGIVAEQTARITRIIQRLLDFTRRKVGTPEQAAVNLNELALTTMELLAGQFSAAKVKTRLDRAEGIPKVAGDRDRLQQVLINLLLNAAQAMPDGGKLRVETRVVHRARPGLEGGAEQQFVQIAVTDTGVGIPAESKDKIFDPFYTTKEGQGGTGLGLAVVSGIVKEHDGWIDVEDCDGGGTAFRVHLPA
ncbi:MAG: HAMP domain-containing protein [Deltaproteobacteria bacterium]|nr:HAMP domain-containing protein [Deltaproteobacteria bacterium]MDQ3364362.1 ATP-binding protein [Myxococcota bacterium]